MIKFRFFKKGKNELATADTKKNPRIKGKVVKDPTVTETEKFIMETVKGQDKQVRQIVNAEYKASRYKIKSNVLIVGKSGTGKTEILKQLAKKTGKACITIDANDYTEEAYQGLSVSDIVVKLLAAANYDVKKAENGIVIIDEIDKKAKSQDTTQRDVSGKGVQDQLLKLVEGKVIPIILRREDGDEMVHFNTEQGMFYFAGAFSGIDEIIKKRLKNKSAIGFATETKSEKQIEEEKMVNEEDLAEYGLEREFVGRIDLIVQLNDLSEDVLEDILLNSKNSKLKKFVGSLQVKDGITTHYTPGIIKAIVKKVKKENSTTGARGLSKVVTYVFDDIMHEVMANPGKYSDVVLLDGIEEDNTRYILK